MTELDQRGQALSTRQLLGERDWDQVQRDYVECSTPRHAVLDDFLTPDALAGIRASVAADTRWQFPHGGSGTEYLPSPASEILLPLAERLRMLLPGLLGALELVDHWALRYHDATGLHAHTDTGQLTVNFYLTPDECNLTPGQGGLLLSKVQRPAEMSLVSYNSAPWSDAYLARADDGTRIRLPYRCNRAVLFDSRTFHSSDTFRFTDTDNASRRVNVGLIFDEPAAAERRRADFVATLKVVRERAEQLGLSLTSSPLDVVEQLWDEARRTVRP